MTLTNVAVIPIHDGINVIHRFTKDGRTATVFKAWRDNGNAHGHDVYIVTTPPQQREDPTNVIAFDNGADSLTDTITASPFDGERPLGAIRFARAVLNGKRETLVIDAELGKSKSGMLADHAPADISIYRLGHPGVEVGTTPDVFKLVNKFRVRGLYCNAEVAMNVALHLPPPVTVGGGPGGCFD